MGARFGATSLLGAVRKPPTPPQTRLSKLGFCEQMQRGGNSNTYITAVLDSIFSYILGIMQAETLREGEVAVAILPIWTTHTFF